MQRARCYLLGETAVVLELEPPITLASQKRIWRLTQRLVDMPNVVEAIPGMNNITVILRKPQTLALDAIERLQRWWEESEALEPDSRSVEIPVIYGGAGGPDLAAVARHSGLSEKQVVELHASVEYVVWFLGFQPGFPYLGNLPEPLHMPRRAEPRLQVPAGSVGIGGAQTGIYPLSTPGGWQLIGLTPLKLFDPMREPPVLLRPGDSVRFVPGLAILCGVFDALAIRELRLSDGALREGVLYEMEGRFRHQDVRSRTAKSLANQYNIDREQARRVLETTMQMYEQWQAQQPKLAHPQLEALLRWAAMLHEVGLNINHSGLHRHSAYILQHSDLPGFNQEQQMMMATLVRYHRKAIKLDDMPRFTLFKKKQYLPLIQLLRLGVLLNNQRQATTTPPTLRLTTDDSHWTLCFPHDWFSQNALVLLDLEKEQQYWEAVTGWRLNIEEESSPEIAA